MMTDRDHFAAAALSGIVAGHHIKPSAGTTEQKQAIIAKQAAKMAYQMAEEMMIEKAKHEADGAG